MEPTKNKLERESESSAKTQKGKDRMPIEIPKSVQNKLIEISKEALFAYLQKKELPVYDNNFLSQIMTQLPKGITGIFVTLYKKEIPEFNEKQSPFLHSSATPKKAPKDLRGCLGRFELQDENLIKEIQNVTILSATEDPRFPSVEMDEFDQLDIEISLLEKPEAIISEAQLDPKKYGVIVHKDYRQGTLLPGIDGVDSVERQISIAKQKAGIALNESVLLFRYFVYKVTFNT